MFRKKSVKSLIILIAVISLVLGACWYLVTYRFKEALQFIVSSESNGTYELNARSIKFSFLDKSVRIREAHLIPADTTEQATRYDVKIPAIFFSIKSWSQILFQSRVAVDSFSIDFPEISIHEHTREEEKNKKITVHASDIFDKLKKVKANLSVRSFTLNNAAFTYGNNNLPGKFSSDRINFSVKNFAETDSSDRFLTSEHVLLDITDQDWKFPNNRHQVRFRQLVLSGEEKIFRIDSCVFSGLDKHNRKFSVSVDRILFSTNNLAALYEKDELIIDSLLLTRPRVTIPTTEKKRYQARDTGHVISNTIREMFSGIRVKYIHIDSGIVLLASSNNIKPLSNSGTDIKVYNLVIAEGDSPLKTDSIILSQKKIAFVTRDNLFKLNIDRFILKDNDLVLTDVEFGPTPQNNEPKFFTFKAPYMTLKEIDLEELIEKKISADAAELINPEMSFTNNTGKGILKSPGGKKASNIARFYVTLRGLNELLDVKSFHIKNGNVSYRAFGDEATYVNLDDIDMQIRLNEFTASDDLMDIKESIRSFATKKMTLYSPSLLVNVEQFQFAGDLRKTRANFLSFHSSRNNIVDLRASHTEWEGLNWDRLFDGDTRLKTFRAEKIDLNINPANGPAEQEPPVHSLPAVSIGNLHIDEINFNSQGKNSLQFAGKALHIEGIRSEDKKIRWSKISATLDSVAFGSNNAKAFVNRIKLNTAATTDIRELLFEQQTSKSQVKISVPLTRSDISLLSSDVSDLHLKSLFIDQPVISYRLLSGQKDSAVSPSLPEFRLDSLAVTNALLEYTNEEKSITAGSGLNMMSTGIAFDSAEGLQFRRLDVNLTGVKLENKKISLLFPDFISSVQNARLRMNSSPGFTGSVSSRWSDGELTLSTGDSSRLTVNNIDGTLKATNIVISGDSVNINELLQKAGLRTGALRYDGKRSGIQFEFLQWQPEERKLVTGPFRLKPHLDEAAYFEKLGWQSEYVTVSGGGLEILQPAYGTFYPKSLTASNILLEDVLITSYRDKTLPVPPHVFKPMFGQMLEKINVPLSVDTVRLVNAKVLVDILSGFTGKRASIPIDSINAVITGLQTFDNGNDSLNITGSLQLYDTRARRIVYREAHNDSLYSFSMRLNASPVTMQNLTNITLPFGNVVVESGYADTLYAQWNGNKYAAVGIMHFYYDGLKVRLVKATDTSKTGLFRKMLSWFANDVLIHKKNKKPTYIFYVRDTEKSVFNYWVKSLLSGAMSSSVIFQEKKLRKKYNKHKDQMKLPEMEF
ncbi:MAG: hypothetical protein KIT80_06550 [Chitinophagaceae bacterium]|nr:hypothetical protein [Chitinophagaceae bacterium]MCW5926556.1 hypothetical protein [Chitinophagaceae bacterium]